MGGEHKLHFGVKRGRKAVPYHELCAVQYRTQKGMPHIHCLERVTLLGGVLVRGPSMSYSLEAGDRMAMRMPLNGLSYSTEVIGMTGVGLQVSST